MLVYEDTSEQFGASGEYLALSLAGQCSVSVDFFLCPRGLKAVQQQAAASSEGGLLWGFTHRLLGRLLCPGGLSLIGFFIGCLYLGLLSGACNPRLVDGIWLLALGQAQQCSPHVLFEKYWYHHCLAAP